MTAYETIRIEREGAAFRRAVADAYRQLAGLFPDRVRELDGSLPVEELAERVRAEVTAGVR